MATVAARDLRNHTAEVLRRVQAGEPVEITVRGEVVAELHPPRPRRRRWIPKRELLDLLEGGQADPALRDLLRELDQSTDDLAPLT